MLSTRHSRAHDSDHHGERNCEDATKYSEARIKLIDTLVAHIGETAGKLEGLGLEKEDALRTSIKMHEAESFFFDDYGHH